MFKAPQLSRFGFINQDSEQREKLATWICRRVLELREERSLFERIRGMLDASWLERYGRSYGADSAESRGSTKAGFGAFFEKGSETTFIWQLDRRMHNKSLEELASFAREILGKSEPCSGLNHRLAEQVVNPLGVASKVLLFLGDYIHVNGTLLRVDSSLNLDEGGTSVKLDFGKNESIRDSLQILHSRRADILGQLQKTDPIHVVCFALWI